MKEYTYPNPMVAPGLGYCHANRCQLVQDREANNLIDRVNQHFGVNLRLRDRKRRVLDIKYATVMVIRNIFPALSLLKIGECFNMDHSTIIYITKNSYHPEIQQLISEIETL